jgi:hypothetical protein
MAVKNRPNEWLLRTLCREAQRQEKHGLARALARTLARHDSKRSLRKIKKWIFHSPSNEYGAPTTPDLA